MNSDLTPVQFIVVKYMPDPFRDEPVNVGIIGRLEGRFVLRTLSTFGRVRRITGNQTSEALETGLALLRSALDRTPNISLEKLVSNCFGIIRFSDVLGGLALEPEEFLDEQFDLYVSENFAQRSSRTITRKQIREQLRKAIVGFGVDASRYAISQKSVLGETAKHDFDFGFENGRPSLLRGISLQTQQPYMLNEARALSFASLDTKKKIQNIRITAVVAQLSPNEITPASDEAFRTIQANVDEVVIIGGDDMEKTLSKVFEHPEALHPLSPELLASDPVGSINSALLLPAS